MATDPKAVSMSTLARVSVRQHTYTDARYSELCARVDAIQVTLRREAETRERRRAREKCAERIMFVILGAILGIVLDRVHSLPTFGIVAIGAAPEVARELVELFARL